MISTPGREYILKLACSTEANAGEGQYLLQLARTASFSVSIEISAGLFSSSSKIISQPAVLRSSFCKLAVGRNPGVTNGHQE